MNGNHRPFLWAIVYVAIGVLVLLLVYLIVGTRSLAGEIRETQTTNTGTLNNTQQTLGLVKSCTTPGQPCYERGQKQTAGAVANINKVVILAATCSVGIDAGMPVGQRQSLIQACVIRRLAADQHKP